jgi:hypothetical protein
VLDAFVLDAVNEGGVSVRHLPLSVQFSGDKAVVLGGELGEAAPKPPPTIVPTNHSVFLPSVISIKSRTDRGWRRGVWSRKRHGESILVEE